MMAGRGRNVSSLIREQAGWGTRARMVELS